ncbi:MAG: hypothetical protein AABZ53_04345 [Planctomycetota bacterium]
MPASSSLNDLLRRLAEALLPNWALSGSWRPMPSGELNEAASVEAIATLGDVRRSGELEAIPAILYVLAHDTPAMRKAGAVAIARLADLIPIGALPGIETRLRRSLEMSFSWNKRSVAVVLAQDWTPQVWGILSMHPSGFVRETAVRRLASCDAAAIALPFLLLRINDWVAPVRIVAIDAVRGCITKGGVSDWTPILGLVDHLRSRSRADHTWLVEEIANRFLRPDARAELMRAANSRDRSIARWAFSTAMRLESDDRAVFVRLGLESTDPVARLRSAGAIKVWKECPDRAALLSTMTADRFMPIRREALYAMLDEAPEIRRACLLSALLDPHPSMRAAARFYLREDARQGVAPFDARAVCLKALETEGGAASVATIAGLGECGIRADADLVAPFVFATRPSVGAAAVRAVASLDRDSRALWFVELIADSRPAIAREAAGALLSSGNVALTAPLRTMLRCGPKVHTRRLAFRVLRSRHPFDAVADAIFAATSPDPALAQAGSEFITRALPWRMPYGPSESQKGIVVAMIAASDPPISGPLLKRVHNFMGMSSA